MRHTIKDKVVRVYDLETSSGQFDKPNAVDLIEKIHCIVVDDFLAVTPEEQKEAVRLLNEADVVVAHNGAAFDYPVLKRFFPEFAPKEQLDTRIISEVVYGGELRFKDIHASRKYNGDWIDPKLYGRHSLQAWGQRLGVSKLDYSDKAKAGEYGEELKEDPFARYIPEMGTYCIVDVEVTRALLNRFDKLGALDTRAAWDESQLAIHLAAMMRRGVGFDEKAAQRLHATLAGRLEELRTEIAPYFKSWYEPDGATAAKALFTPKKDNVKRGYTGGAELTKVRRVTLNPASDAQLAGQLQRQYGWKPEVFTERGQPVVSAEVLRTLPYEPIKLLTEFAVVAKRLSQLSEGRHGWLKVANEGNIYGKINSNGTRTGRATHYGPNLAQVPAVGAPYGKACRQLFKPRPGYVLVGADSSGVELRMLAHYAARIDGGALGRTILQGDVHTENQKAAGLKTRGAAKTVAYAMLYGAGDAKLGETYLADLGKQGNATKAGKLVRRGLDSVLKSGILSKQLVEALTKRGYIKAIDGRKLLGVSKRVALNSLLQSAGSVATKVAINIMHRKFEAAGLVEDRDVGLLLFVHDEVQVEAKPEHAELVAKIAVESIREAGKELGLRVPLDGEAKVGSSWASTH